MRGDDMIVELKNPITLEVSGKGPGLGIALIDHGPDHELVVVVSLKTGEITAEKLSSLKGIGVYVTGQTVAQDDLGAIPKPAMVDSAGRLA
jgi:hypothetical protein